MSYRYLHLWPNSPLGLEKLVGGCYARSVGVGRTQSENVATKRHKEERSIASSPCVLRGKCTLSARPETTD